MAASVADAVAVNPSTIKMRLTNDLGTVFVNGKPTFINRPRKLLRNPP